ncbi:lipoprotein OmlA [Ameyamaea chiangmaiensis NBRC 103196]|uniref:Outer membrane protein assembly factor BamE n=1 Tax=Ameyamaea chiangmaiensis TaxID=442969 RepID=A0A850P5N0_9PROT|nr:outer membrane protein assembly factor BamE [Ameyamaea chiangmaiensis]MBS4074498.1 outer membrane protein assembly factor BamE [Ameyamaea chiangmaiensis]NVN39238.1 outer membrane protein assembly factor BamE [Ameyamaea chiangmaiensis]GBQ72258.1 lipoprotein OmlA [Ameyamaea chiangmaiensis NBRC 103196]
MPPASTRPFPRFRTLLIAGGLGLSLGGCSMFSPIPQPRGSLVEADDYKTLTPGTSNKNDVLDAMGSPTSHATFDDNTWIYISMVTTPRPLSFPGIRKQDVVVLKFDQGGTLTSLKTFNKHDAHYVGMEGDTTPTPGTKINIMQQILGNVGRYNPMSGMGNSAFGGSTGPMNANAGPGHGGTGNSIP